MNTVDVPATVTAPGRMTAPRDLQAGYVVHDITGGRHTLTKVRHFKTGCRITRTDGHTEWLDYMSPIRAIAPEFEPMGPTTRGRTTIIPNYRA